MKMQCYRLPEKLMEEDIGLMNEFCMQDPEGDFNEEEWQKFFNANASSALKRAKRKQKRVLSAAPPSVHI